MKILLIEDHQLFRAGLRLLLANFAETAEFGEAATCEAALQLAELDAFDLVLLDFHLKGISGLQALTAIREKLPAAAVVVLSADESPKIIRSCIDCGAAGYIPKTSSHAVMVAALRLVLAGGTYLPTHCLAAMSNNDDQAGSISLSGNRPVDGISDRQMEVLRLAIRGQSNKLIARQMNLSEPTVKAHLSSAFRALGVHNRTEAVYAAARFGIT